MHVCVRACVSVSLWVVFFVSLWSVLFFFWWAEREKNQHTRRTVEALEDKYRELQVYALSKARRSSTKKASRSTQ